MPMHPSDLPALLAEHAERLSAYLGDVLARQAQAGAPARLIEAIDYSLSAGGKRLRPALVLEANRLLGKPGASALAAAAAIELIHTFSLVHDDLPAMDDDDLRRGRPTNHKVFGEATAILAGDAMMTLAFDVVATDADADLVAPLTRELARASGPFGMIGGQILDIDGENRTLDLSALQQIHRMKTGALLTASCRLGAIAARAPDEQLDALSRFGRHLGLAFQIVDDLLDETATPEQMGKATNKDAGRGKNTYPRLLGLDESKRQATQQMDQAIESLALFGDRADRLIALARFVVERSH